MGPGGPKVIHVGYTPANVEEVFFPHAEVVGDVGPSLDLLADRLEGRLHRAGALLPLREGILQRITDRATEDRFPPTPQRICARRLQVIPKTDRVARPRMYRSGSPQLPHLGGEPLLSHALAPWRRPAAAMWRRC